jgi:Uma2 family endonuclease
MVSPFLDLPTITDRHAFNLARWKEICADSRLAQVEGRVESDTYGHILMSPPPSYDHSRFQYRIARMLGDMLGHAGTSTECPVSTRDGIRGIDVVWLSDARRVAALRDNVLVVAPEICVEVLSPGNTRDEMAAKRTLLFDAGADEVWLCDTSGRMFFFHRDRPTEPAERSTRCPGFPGRLDEAGG